MMELLEAGTHFGHERAKWNPKMAPAIFDLRNNVHIIDLAQTLRQLKRATEFIRQVVKEGKTVLFVGTKRQAREIVAREAQRCGMPYVTTRWLGGTFTNFSTVKKSIERLQKLREERATNAWRHLTKKERAVREKTIERLEKVLSGIREMTELPGAVFLMGAYDEKLAALEARRTGITVIGVVDTNADPDLVDIPIPGNDDALRSIELLTRAIADAVQEGKRQAEREKSTAATVGKKKAGRPADMLVKGKEEAKKE